MDISPKWSANVFKVERDAKIVSISFHTTDNNAEYKVYVNNLGKDKPSYPGTAVSEPVLSGVMPYAGYHDLTLAAPIDLYAGDYYSVIVSMVTQYEYHTAAEGTVEGYFTASVNEDESYFASGDAVPSVWSGGDMYNATVRTRTVARPSAEVRPTITTTQLPAGRAGEAYQYRLEAQGSAPIKWRVGKLPRGLSLSSEGVLSGNCESAEEEYVKFTASNNVGSADVTLHISITGGSTPVDVPQEGGDISGAGGGCSSGFGMCGVLLAAAAAFRNPTDWI